MKSSIVVICCMAFCSFLPLTDGKTFVKENFRFASVQLKNMLVDADKSPNIFPKTIDAKGNMHATNLYDWTTGFFPGNLWLAAESLHDKALENKAIEWTNRLEPLQYFTQHHDLGFMMYCSYGNAYRLTGNKAYRDILIQSAKSLCTRFNKTAGSIKSWNKFVSWHGNKTYEFPVIIDNMMNLELLFFASKQTGDPVYKEIAIKHAETTMKYQIRDDFSSYHVVCYDTLTGKLVGRETAQGYADNSTWSRGQAWGIYGFTMVYRETKDPKFLKTAMGMADWYLNSKTLPKDKVPYWDFNMGDSAYHPGKKSHAFEYPQPYRDASAAAITASALFELANYAGAKSKWYQAQAITILESLASPTYRATEGSDANFLLKHSVGSIAHGVEIDVPLIYADYYFLEALQRYQKIIGK
jgi:unsaturated chondroitin disaccharide hydrolase